MTGRAETAGLRAGHEPRTDDRRLHRALATVPFLLLVLALVFTIAAGGPPLETGLPWIVVLTSLTFALRLWWQLKASTQRRRIAAFMVNLVLTFLLISLSPLYGVYAFVGYLDAVAVFAAPAQVYALVAAGSLNALAQLGGPAGAASGPTSQHATASPRLGAP